MHDPSSHSCHFSIFPNLNAIVRDQVESAQVPEVFVIFLFSLFLLSLTEEYSGCQTINYDTMVVKSPGSCDLGFVEVLLYYLLAKNEKKREGDWVSRISHEKELK